MFYISNLLAALLLVALLLEMIGPKDLFFWLLHAVLMVEIAFLLLSNLALSFKKPRMALLFQSLAILVALIGSATLLIVLDPSNIVSSKTLRKIMIGAIPLLPPVLSIFLLQSSLKHTEQSSGIVL
ncbi:MAG: hypothetical protein QM758_06965 [Armatimonas sp.]